MDVSIDLPNAAVLKARLAKFRLGGSEKRLVNTMVQELAGKKLHADEAFQVVLGSFDKYINSINRFKLSLVWNTIVSHAPAFIEAVFKEHPVILLDFQSRLGSELKARESKTRFMWGKL